ncbi:hypothetical protein ACWGJW_11410 [Streptomyces nigrescens]
MPGGAKPPVFPVAAIDDPALPEMLAGLAAARADEMDADTVNRELSIARKAIGWWQRQGWTAAEHEPTPAPHSLTVSRQARQLRLPLDAYASTVAETHLVEDAQDILMRRGLKGRGLEWKTLPLVDAQDTEPPNLRRYGADEAEALRNGYHPSPDPPSVIRRSRAWDAREALPAEMRRAAYGRSGKGGCLKTASATAGRAQWSNPHLTSVAPAHRSGLVGVQSRRPNPRHQQRRRAALGRVSA